MTTQELYDAAQNGNYMAQHELSCHLFEGSGIDKNISEAIYWARKSAEAGYPLAQNNLGIALIEGYLFKDIKEGLFWINAAANNGDVSAMAYLGSLYMKGEILDKIIDDAILWLTRAGNLGECNAMINLTNLYAEEKNIEMNNFWANTYNNYCKAQKDNNAAVKILQNDTKSKDAKALLISAAENGCTKAMLNLARFYVLEEEPHTADEIVSLVYEASMRDNMIADPLLMELLNHGCAIAATKAYENLGYTVDPIRHIVYKAYNPIKYKNL